MKNRRALPAILACFLATPASQAQVPVDPDDTSLSLEWRTCAGMEVLGEPTAVFTPHPTYPASALRSHLSGVVVVGATINAHGSLENSRVLRQNHPSLVGASLQALRLWRYQPAFKGPQRIAVPIIVTLEYKLVGSK